MADLKVYQGTYDEETLAKEGKIVIGWPESQALMDAPCMEEYCQLIDDAEGYETFGSSAYVVNKDWFDSVVAVNQ